MKNKRRLATALSAVVLAFSTTAPAFAQSTADEAPAYASASRSAPADEYFGPLRLSVLGIRNSIAETTLRLDRVGLEVGDTMRNVGLVEASVRDWESKYPGDSWLPGIVLSLHRVYRRIGTQEAITHSIDVAM